MTPAAHTASALQATDVPVDAVRPAASSKAISMSMPFALIMSTPAAAPEHAVADEHRHPFDSHTAHDTI